MALILMLWRKGLKTRLLKMQKNKFHLAENLIQKCWQEKWTLRLLLALAWVQAHKYQKTLLNGLQNKIFKRLKLTFLPYNAENQARLRKDFNNKM